MKAIGKTMISTVFFVVLSCFIKVSAQITDAKDIPEGYTPIYNISDLYAINNDLKGKYILMADIDMSSTAPGGDWDFGKGWQPIGYTSAKLEANRFYGEFDGNGHKIYNLNIYGYIPYEEFGFFGSNYGEIHDLGFEGVNIDLYKSDGYYHWTRFGVVAGYSAGEIYNCYVCGEINDKLGCDYLGGITGGLEDKTWKQYKRSGVKS